MSKIKTLFATRAIESPPREGGFVLLSDIAGSIVEDAAIEPFFFSATKQSKSKIGIEKVFSKPGWSKKTRLEFILGLRKSAHKYSVVHTAHIPTRQNVRLIKLATRQARRKGTKFVQTITGLPKLDISSQELNKLLWGDYIVCQSKTIFNQVRTLRDSASLISPWRPSSVVRYDDKHRAALKGKFYPDSKSIVVFPGEFDRLGVDKSFAECLKIFLEETTDSIVVLACRFDKKGTGKALADKFPGRVISLGETKQIMPLLEAADLVIYPTRKMDSKFQPPLVLVEAVQLGTPVLVSHMLDFSPSVQANVSNNWDDFANKMVDLINRKIERPLVREDEFENMVKTYKTIYQNLAK